MVNKFGILFWAHPLRKRVEVPPPFGVSILVIAVWLFSHASL